MKEVLFFLVPVFCVVFIFAINEIQVFKKEKEFNIKQYGRSDGWSK